MKLFETLAMLVICAVLLLLMLALFPVIVCTVWWGIVAPAWRKSTCLNRREDRRLWE